MSFNFYPLAGTEPTVSSLASVYSPYYQKMIFCSASGLHSMDSTLQITNMLPIAGTYTTYGITVDESNGDIYFILKQSANSNWQISKFTEGGTHTVIHTSSSTTLARNLFIEAGYLYAVMSNASLHRRALSGGTLAFFSNLPTSNTAASGQRVVKIGSDFYYYANKSVLKSSDLSTWVQSHVPNPYTGAQTTWFVISGFDYHGKHVCIVRYDTSGTIKTAVLELNPDGTYQDFCPRFNGDCQGYGLVHGRLFLNSGYLSSPQRSLFSVVLPNGKVVANKQAPQRFSTSMDAEFCQVGNMVIWLHDAAFAYSDPYIWIDSNLIAAGWVMGG